MFRVLIPVTILALTLSAAGPGKEETVVPKEFNERIAEYLKVRKKAAQGVPALKPKATPEQIHARKVTISQAVREARTDAQQGNVFTPEVQEYFLKIIRSEMRGKDGVPAKATAKQGNPATEGPAKVVVKVNAPYPDGASLSSVPSTLLLRLPQLPKELDFRFVGRHMILRDIEASMIVDYILNATP